MAIADVTPRRIGPYEVHGLLGEGGIGQVYAAEDTLLGRQVAIKALRPEMSRDRNLIDRFYIEAKSLANLNHPNITTLYALQLEGQDAFMIMELVHGHTLNDLLARVHRLRLREGLAVAAQAVAGLGYAHRRGVIHRDIKPSNLMLTDEGVLKIMDFGIARVRGSQQMTRTGDFQGTLAYASPEQIRGERVDERSDLYSLAIVIYKLLSGVAPFDAASDYALMTAHLQTPPPPLLGRVPGLDAATETALMRALAKQPEDRFASIGEFGQAIGAAALRNESVDILQQLFDRAFREDAEATRVVTARASAEQTEPPTQPTPRAAAVPETVQIPATPPAAATVPETVQRVAAAAVPETVQIPSTPPAAATVRATAPRATSRPARWSYVAVGGGLAAAAVAAGWFVLAPMVPERPGAASVAPNQPQVAAETAAPPSAAPVTSASPGRPGEAQEAARHDQPAPASEQRAASVEPAVVAPARNSPPANSAAPEKTTREETAPPKTAAPDSSPAPDKIAPATAVAPAPDKVAPPTAVAVAPDKSLPAEVSPSVEKPEPAPAAEEHHDPAPAKTDDAKTEPQPSATQLATKEMQPPAEKPAPLGPEAKPVPPQPEGKPDLEGKITGIKRAEMEVSKQWIQLYGITIDRSRPDDVLVPYVQPARFEVVCYRKPANTYRCYADGQDIAQLALKDHKAQLAPNAPTEYRSLLSQKR